MLAGDEEGRTGRVQTGHERHVLHGRVRLVEEGDATVGVVLPVAGYLGERGGGISIEARSFDGLIGGEIAMCSRLAREKFTTAVLRGGTWTYCFSLGSDVTREIEAT